MRPRLARCSAGIVLLIYAGLNISVCFEAVKDQEVSVLSEEHFISGLCSVFRDRIQ